MQQKLTNLANNINLFIILFFVMTLYSIEVPNRLSTEYGGHSPQKQSLSNKLILTIFQKLKIYI